VSYDAEASGTARALALKSLLIMRFPLLIAAAGLTFTLTIHADVAAGQASGQAPEPTTATTTAQATAATTAPTTEQTAAQTPAQTPPQTPRATPADTSSSDSTSAKATPAADAQPPRPARDATPAQAAPSPIARWLDLQQAQLAMRYRDIKTSAGPTSASQVQDSEYFKLRVKFDPKGLYGVNVGIFSGATFTGGWNITGPGTGDATHDLHVKQLFLDAQPVKGLTGQIGSLYFWRGESSEITTYDNDGYFSGERVSVKRPKALYFDEVLFTQGYIGDLSLPNYFDRANRLDTVNYRQVAVAKNFAKRAGLSLDFTTLDILANGTPNTSNLKQASFQSDWLRIGSHLSTPELKFVDTLRFEAYRRYNRNEAGGFAASGEHAFGKRFNASLGFASIDRLYGGLSGDSYGLGRRVFSKGTYALTPEFSLGYFLTRSFANDFAISNRTRGEVVFTYNLLKSLQRTHRF
jgi:hypothetical protein